MGKLGKYKSEMIGISEEIAIDECFNIEINPKYLKRANEGIVKNFMML